ncbi:putative nuclease HARBI1 [Anastrepha obliqua]|uniref:putative nuclease HARBI1 n=1 Tax=Anastrepha obliqua TaxID=95512 RepID=UPI00240A577C|nr:putative nuclease HARBI1 [Anastrepha obliqua]
MDCVALWDESSEERIYRRFIRDNSNVMSLSDQSFVQNFRLSKEAFMYVLNSIKGEMKSPTRATAIPDIIKVATTLKFLAQGAYQHLIGQDHRAGLAQQTVSSCLWEVCSAIEKVLCPKHIVFSMSSEEQQDANRRFYETCGIPGVVGAVDGTHIQMIRPSNDEHLFFNRKLKHSINAMVICDHKMQIRAVNGRFGGASHDSHIWNLSGEREYLKTAYENGDSGQRILGDSGYPLEPWLLTPYRNSTEDSDEHFFNQKHSKGRSLIERVFGVLKGRFRCLLASRELHYAPEKVVQILNACCALHNICIMFKVHPPSLEIEQEQVNMVNIENVENLSFGNIARRIRDQIKNDMIATRNSV